MYKMGETMLEAIRMNKKRMGEYFGVDEDVVEMIFHSLEKSGVYLFENRYTNDIFYHPLTFEIVLNSKNPNLILVAKEKILNDIIGQKMIEEEKLKEDIRAIKKIMKENKRNG